VASDRRIGVTTRINRDIWFRTQALAKAHRVPLERVVEEALRDVLERVGVEPVAGQVDLLTPERVSGLQSFAGSPGRVEP
jgi:hypothetical protein